MQVYIIAVDRMFARGHHQRTGNQQTVRFVYSEAVYRALSHQYVTIYDVTNSDSRNPNPSPSDKDRSKQLLTNLHSVLGLPAKTHEPDDNNSADTSTDCEISNLDAIYREVLNDLNCCKVTTVKNDTVPLKPRAGVGPSGRSSRV